MKKKLVSVLLAATVVSSMLAGCGSSESTTETATEETATEETAEETTEETTEESAESTEEASEETAEETTEEAAAEEEEEFVTQEVGDDGIKIWVADNVVDFTKEQVAAFQEANPDYADFTIVVEPVGEGDAAGNMITDVEAGADIYAFAQDQIARLVTAGALEEVAPDNVDAVKSENDAGAVSAATVGDTLYAYPITSDNG